MEKQSFVLAFTASISLVSFVYALLQKLRFRENFLVAFISVFFLNFLTLLAVNDAVEYKEIIIKLASLPIFFIAATEYLYVNSCYSQCCNLSCSNKKFYFFLFILIFPISFFIEKAIFLKIVYAASFFIMFSGMLKLFKKSKFQIDWGTSIFALFLMIISVKTLVFAGRFTLDIPIFSLLYIVSVYMKLSYFNNISYKQYIKFVVPVGLIYLFTLIFSYYFSQFYYVVEMYEHNLPSKRNVWIIWSHLSFFTAIASYFFFSLISDKVRNRFLKKYEKKYHRLNELTLDVNPLSGSREIFCYFATCFEETIGLKIINAMVFKNKNEVLLFTNKDNFSKYEIKKVKETLRKHILKRIILPSEFFFRNTSGLFKNLDEAGIENNFGFIIPIYIEDEFEGVYLTEPFKLSKKFNMPKIYEFLYYFKSTVENIISNSKNLRKEKEVQEKMLLLQEKKKISEEYRRKNEELQKALEYLKSKQDQLIIAEKWASICEITVSLNHEINNPLTHILGSSQLLKMHMEKNKFKTPQEIIPSMIKIESQCQRIKDIVENLRKISEPVAINYLENVKMLKLRSDAGDNG